MIEIVWIGLSWLGEKKLRWKFHVKVTSKKNLFWQVKLSSTPFTDNIRIALVPDFSVIKWFHCFHYVPWTVFKDYFLYLLSLQLTSHHNSFCYLNITERNFWRNTVWCWNNEETEIFLKPHWFNTLTIQFAMR